MNFLMSYPKSVHLRAVTCGDKGFDFVLADKSHDGRKLILSQQRLDLYMLLTAVSACYII